MIEMSNGDEIKKLFNEDTRHKNNCNLCKEAAYEMGQNTGYGIVIYKIGTLKNGWLAILSPKTGGDPKIDFTVQLIPSFHLTHFSQIASHLSLMENYGIAFSKVCRAVTEIIMEDSILKAVSDEKSASASIAAYGKCATWKEKKEHLHIKVFPFRGNIGQPYTVDSSFGKKEIFKEKTGEEFVKMKPIKKVMIDAKRFNDLAKRLIYLLK